MKTLRKWTIRSSLRQSKLCILCLVSYIFAVNYFYIDRIMFIGFLYLENRGDGTVLTLIGSQIPKFSKYYYFWVMAEAHLHNSCIMQWVYKDYDIFTGFSDHENIGLDTLFTVFTFLMIKLHEYFNLRVMMEGN